eukprot:s9589_g1.t1
MVQEVDSEDGFELPCSSVQCFTIGSDSESDQAFAVDLTTDGSSDFGDGVVHVRAVAADPNLHEVLLDSGADCTVLPLEAFADVGHHSHESSFLLDAQGDRIPQGQVRTSVIFEVDGEDGEVIQFRDKAVLAQVRQPLFCFGKLLRDHWVLTVLTKEAIEPSDLGGWYVDGAWVCQSVLRYDTEPAMKQLVSSIVAVRAKNNLATELEPVGPDSLAHGALRSERYHQTVRNLGNCLLKTVEQRTGHKAETWGPLHSWAYVHAAFLVTRFHVHRDGCTSHELVHGRKYDQKLCPFGSAVYAQPPKAYDVELLKTMRGTPYDFLLDVVPVRKKKVDKERLPILVEAAAPALLPAEEAANTGPGDEAASDPGSSSSTELIPEPMAVEAVNQAAEEEDWELVSAEGGLPTGHFEEEGFKNVPQDWDEIFEETWEIEGVLQEAERRKYEEGPPVLDDEVLAALDAEMDEVEIQRLLGMKVLEEIGPDEDMSDMYRLGCKNVRDWRFRNGWVRRSRLVAKEVRFLQPHMGDLYSPASLSSSE